MKVFDEDTWEAEYWDEYLLEFGPDAYVKARYGYKEVNYEPEGQDTSAASQGTVQEAQQGRAA